MLALDVSLRLNAHYNVFGMSDISLLIFFLLSGILIYCCRTQLLNPNCHGFYRFFAFEGIVLQAVLNIDFTNLNPFAPLKLVSALLLLSSLACLIASVRQLREKGGSHHRDHVPENFAFENTVQLVNSGIYRYLRHPMYTSLLLLNWGIFLQQPSLVGTIVPLLVSVMIFITARVEERENQVFFKQAYCDYKKSSRMLIPFVF